MVLGIGRKSEKVEETHVIRGEHAQEIQTDSHPSWGIQPGTMQLLGSNAPELKCDCLKHIYLSFTVHLKNNHLKTSDSTET